MAESPPAPPLLHVPECFDGLTSPVLLARLERHARAVVLAATASPAFAGAWWDGTHAEFGRSPRDEAASGWAGMDRVIRTLNRTAMGAP